MIKVLHIGHSRKWRGGENQVRLLIEGLSNQYQDVKCFIAYPKGAIAIDRLQSNVAGILNLPSTRPYDLRSILAIVRYCRDNKIQILNAQSGNAHTLAFYSKLFLPNVKLVVHRRVDNLIKTSWLTKTKYLSTKIDRWIAISSKIAAILDHYGVEKNRISTIKSSVKVELYLDVDKASAKQGYCEKFNWDSKIPIVGFAGALDHQKNPQLFVQIIAELNERGENVNALIAGNGDLLQEVKNEIEIHKLDANVKLLGFIENTRRFFCATDIFLLPSRNEGLGTVLLEAVHAQCVVVAADVGGISEIIIDEQTGLLAAADSKSDFVDAIVKIINDPQQANLFTSCASQHVKDNFELNSMIKRTYGLYQSLI